MMKVRDWPVVKLSELILVISEYGALVRAAGLTVIRYGELSTLRPLN